MKDRSVGIYLLADAQDCTGGSFKIQGDTGMAKTIGKDFSDTVWPVVVKHKPETPPERLVKFLRDLADAIESGFQVEIAPELESPVPNSYAKANEKREIVMIDLPPVSR